MADVQHEVPAPSDWWCKWQALKGAHFGHLPTPDADLRGKTVVLTGGNNGIGREASLQFAKYGANIVLGCRHPPPHEKHPDFVIEECEIAAKAAGHANSKFEWWECDMADFASVEHFARRWLATDQALDILCNNAGIVGRQGELISTKDRKEIVHQVNFLSHVLLTMYLLPSLARAREPRVICTTSCMQFYAKFDLETPNSGHHPYPKAKLMLQTFVTELQSRLLEHEQYRHITVQGVHPGYVITGIWNRVNPEDAGTGKVGEQRVNGRMGWVEWALNLLLYKIGIDAQQGSLAITYAATQPECGPNPAMQGVGAENGKGGGRYWNRTWEEEPMPQTKAQHTRNLLWAYVVKELDLERRGLLSVLGS